MNTTAELLAAAEQSLARLQDACLARCRRLAGDARALLEEASDA